ncbi:hypothetical protein IE81DRAFT_284765 [Ceraceosorus guamensis]|uniref:Fe2OG dioxygenase domain-containing protein n=1 Tax=Ceraceosorus guamensis TaxID=1522189 RepID=A0A316WF44_9BASI|nr:hypothetical protein IE81DRAFT_284765 [Ceraceosorus guamensis]PWN45925.1 hypothetical protein IE81DRAFT_284765 [Ceraceosorus guamensis]
MSTSSSSAATSGLARYQLDIPTSALASSSTRTRTSSTSDRSASSQSQHGFFYIPDFITAEEERYLMGKINSAPQPKWKVLQARRLQHWGGQIAQKSGTLIPEPLPDWLVRFPNIVQRVRETKAFVESKHEGPNHCLVNEYEAGQGIMPHEDGGAYFAAVATLSLGSHTLLDIYRWAPEEPTATGSTDHDEADARAREQHPVFSILQERRSLLITRGDAYKDYLHGIADRSSDTTQHFARVINGSSIKAPHLQQALISAGVAVQSDPAQAFEVLPAGAGTKQLPRVGVERQTRVSITMRDVERVSKGLGGVLGRR